MHRLYVWGILPALVASIFCFCGEAHAAISGMTRVANGLSTPIFVTHAPGDRERLFIVERGGGVRILDLNTGALVPSPFLSISGINTSGEGGLLGMAFHPDYDSNGKFYVYVTASDAIGGTPFSSYIREYAVSGDPNVANTSFNPVLTWAQPQSNHNAGWIGFSPNDDYLYISSGDGGGSDDNDSGHTSGTGNAQDITNNLLGKMLRIDVDGDDFPVDANRNYAIPADNPFVDVTGDDEIWAYGLRNPFRDSFDRLTGDLWIGDVGQGAREEIDFQPADSTGGENYGWRLREGTIATPSGGVGGAPPLGNVDPVYDYNRDNDAFGGTVVTGGYVYRGPDPTLQGQYFFLDSRNSASASVDNYWTFDPADPFGTVANIDSLLRPDTGTRQFPVSFGEDAKGNLYIAYLVSGNVYRIATNELLPGDYDADGDVDEEDYGVWKDSFGSTTVLAADGNGNDIVDAADYTVWRDNLGASLGAGSGATGSATVPEPFTVRLAAQFVALALVIGRRRRTIECRRQGLRTGGK